ncbi:hypothetical protein LIER_39208 [Lithospermum erythrorhizon]|uniref:Uncharacterized protein n=1 Tax=Lithospermum erythrorhizon TaxID=34254 RepID=A0AAV3QB40_LITER
MFILDRKNLFSSHGTYQVHYRNEAFSPYQKGKICRVMKFASASSPSTPPSSTRPVVGLFIPRTLPDKAVHDALLPLLDQGVVEALEQELQGFRLQATEAIHHRWELALLVQEFRKAEEEKAAACRAARAARQQMEGLRRA